MSLLNEQNIGYSDLLNMYTGTFDNTNIGTLTITGNANISYLNPYQLLCLDLNNNVIGKSLTNGQVLIGQTGGSSSSKPYRI